MFLQYGMVCYLSAKDFIKKVCSSLLSQCQKIIPTGIVR